MNAINIDHVSDSVHVEIFNIERHFYTSTDDIFDEDNPNEYEEDAFDMECDMLEIDSLLNEEYFVDPGFDAE